jgi:rod shape determining protein RodA
MKFELTPVKTIIICLLFLNIFSLSSLFSSLHEGGKIRNMDIFYKQIIWIAIAWLFLLCFSFINYRLYYEFSFIFYALNIILLIAVIFFGKRVMGAQRWLTFAGVTFQPSEVSKAAAVFILARLFAEVKRNSSWRDILLPLILILINAFLIFKQPDLGTALILIILFFMISFSSPIKKRYLIFIIIAGLVFSPFAWNFLKDYQKKRLVVFLNPDEEPLGAGYTIIQSKIAIGSGKILGKGFLSGTQNQFNFLPERHTDFIFTVVAEEWGILGSLFLIMIYGLILRKILEKIRELKDPFAQFLSLGISSLFFLHIFINIGMTLGIIPVVGLPLIFMSYGGTHLLISFILTGIFFNIARTS